LTGLVDVFFDQLIYTPFLLLARVPWNIRGLGLAVKVNMVSYEVEQSFRNIVRFYAHELYMIDNGKKATKFFNERQRRSLTKNGVLEKIYVHRGCRLKISEKAKAILNSIDLSSVTLTDLL